ERTLPESRNQRHVVALIDIRLAAVVRRERQQAVRRQTDQARLQIVEAAHLVSAAVRQIRVGRRAEAERTVIAAAIVALIDRQRLVAERAAIPPTRDRDARCELVL